MILSDKKKKAIVTGGNNKVIDPMAVLAINIKEVSTGLGDELIIFHDGISKTIQEKFNKIMPTRFIKYKCPVPRIKLLTNPVIRYFSPMVFSKIECFRLLKDYDTVTWIDYDMLIKEDITELLHHEHDYNLLIDHNVPLKEMFRPGYEKLCLDKRINIEAPSMVAALFSLNRNSAVNYDEWCSWYYEQLVLCSKYLYLPEQVLMTMMLQNFGIEYSEIDANVYNCHPVNDSGSAKIIHSYGEKKFWNGIENDNWNNYYKIWKELS